MYWPPGLLLVESSSSYRLLLLSSNGRQGKIQFKMTPTIIINIRNIMISSNYIPKYYFSVNTSIIY